MRKNFQRAIAAALLASVIALLGMVPYSSAADVIRFTATDGGMYGNALSWYPRTIVTKFQALPTNATRIEYYLNDVKLDTGPSTENYGVGGFKWDATKLESGDYKLKAVVKTPTEEIVAQTWNGTEYMSFQVKNASAPSARFAAPDGSTIGTAKDWYSRKLTTGLLERSEGIETIKYYVDDQLVGTNTRIADNTVDGIEIDSLTLKNGEHKLSATLINSAGIEGKVKAYNGNPYLVFTVDNAADTPKDQPLSRCQTRQTVIDGIAKRITARAENELQIIQSVVSNIDAYHNGLEIKLENYDTVITTLKNDEVAAEAALVDMVSASAITCNESGVPQTQAFKDSTKALLEALAQYKTDALSLIQQLEDK